MVVHGDGCEAALQLSDLIVQPLGHRCHQGTEEQHVAENGQHSRDDPADAPLVIAQVTGVAQAKKRPPYGFCWLEPRRAALEPSEQKAARHTQRSYAEHDEQEAINSAAQKEALDLKLKPTANAGKHLATLPRSSISPQTVCTMLERLFETSTGG